ncbi:unnamed protein product [Brugia timori]|uniref:Uncharacterized protein n=1 Tax=Brugia timori TaxID=42155 RepID=A0A3P7Z917_9BILA|nr:unnamed protein product [Brugia timori]
MRYQRMTPEQRKAYNQKRYTPKRKRLENSEDSETNMNRGRKRNQDEQFDALSTLERDVIKRTQQLQQIHPQQIQNQSSQQQPQQQIQYTVSPAGQMMVGQHLQQQLLTPYATVPPRA